MGNFAAPQNGKVHASVRKPSATPYCETSNFSIMDILKHNIYINCNVGANTITDCKGEIEKIKTIKDSGDIPDMMMDLSLVLY